MHLVGDNQRLPKSHRTTPERFFKYFNVLIAALFFATYLVQIAETAVSITNTYSSNIWATSDFELDLVLAAKLANCSPNGGYTTSVTFRGFPDTPVTINYGNVPWLFAELAAAVRTCIIVTGISVFLSVANKLLFYLNVFECHFKRVVWHKEILTTAEIFFLVVVFVSVSNVDAYRGLLGAYLASCTQLAFSTLPFQNFVPIYVGASVTLAFHGVTMLIYLYNTLNKKVVLPSGADKTGLPTSSPFDLHTPSTDAPRPDDA